MAAAVVHEINNPLASLSSRLTRMERSDDPSCARASTFCEDGSRASAGLSTPYRSFREPPTQARTTWDVNAAVDEALSVVKLDPRAAEVHFEWQPAASDLCVNAVRDEIPYANPLINAVEATPQDGGVLVRAFADNGEVGDERQPGTGVAGSRYRSFGPLPEGSKELET